MLHCECADLQIKTVSIMEALRYKKNKSIKIQKFKFEAEFISIQQSETLSLKQCKNHLVYD